MTDEIKMKAIEWLLGRDTGISSKTMCGALFGINPAWRDIPYDADDFGRCLRFIRFMPAGAQYSNSTVYCVDKELVVCELCGCCAPKSAWQNRTKQEDER